MGSGGVWSADGWFFHTFEQKAAIVCSLKCTNSHISLSDQADSVVDSSLTPIVALLMHPGGTAHSTVDYHHRNDAGESRPVALPFVCLDRVYECGFHFKPLFGFQFMRVLQI